MNRPQPEEYSSFHSDYINTVGNNVIAELGHQASAFPEFLKSISEEKSLYAYADGKWTIRQVIGHLIDTERILAYRALRLSRNDQTPLPGFDENAFVQYSNFNSRTLQSLSDEFASVRHANLFLFNSFDAIQVERKGTCSNATMSVKALIFIIAGHINHHWRILEDRYL